MTDTQHKLKHLRATMLHWGEENKPLPDEWKKDFKWATKVDGRLSDGTYKHLTKLEMEMCNKLYKYYGSVYDTI